MTTRRSLTALVELAGLDVNTSESRALVEDVRKIGELFVALRELEAEEPTAAAIEASLMRISDGSPKSPLSRLRLPLRDLDIETREALGDTPPSRDLPPPDIRLLETQLSALDRALTIHVRQLAKFESRGARKQNARRLALARLEEVFRAHAQEATNDALKEFLAEASRVAAIPTPSPSRLFRILPDSKGT